MGTCTLNLYTCMIYKTFPSRNSHSFVFHESTIYWLSGFLWLPPSGHFCCLFSWALVIPRASSLEFSFLVLVRQPPQHGKCLQSPLMCWQPKSWLDNFWNRLWPSFPEKSCEHQISLTHNLYQPTLLQPALSLNSYQRWMTSTSCFISKSPWVYVISIYCILGDTF